MLRMPVLKTKDDCTPMEVDEEIDEDEPWLTNGTSNGLEVIEWDFSSSEPENLSSLLNLKSLANEKLRKEEQQIYQEYGETALSIKNMLQETLLYKEKIRKFVESKAYLFTTPVEELPSHSSFIRDYLSNNNGIAINGSASVVDGLEVLSEVSADKSNLPPRGEFKRKALKPGDAVYVMKTDFTDRFVPGLVMALREGDTYKVRLEESRGTILKLYSSKELAYKEPCDVVIPVGTRITARYSDGMYAGVTAEIPISTNKDRYLIFFDDGYAQYVMHEDVRVMCSQSNDVSNDVNTEVKLFVHEYLAKYPERAMLKLQVNQRIKTEYEFNWLDTKVLEVDCSMVQLLFLASGRKEWLYRGSTRLKVLYDELSSAQANRLAGKHRRHNILPRKPHQPYVEYTRDVVTIESDSDTESSSSSAQQATQNVSGVKPKNTARKSSLQRNKDIPPAKPSHRPRDYKSHLGNKSYDKLESYQRSRYKSHQCSNLCREIRDPAMYKGKNILTIPLHVGWERHLRKARVKGQQTQILVMYRAPCGRTLRTMQEIQDYLCKVSSKLPIDYFTLESNVMVFRTFTPKDILYEIDDVTNGKERIPISCVNAWAPNPPQFIEYAAKRFVGKGVEINEDKEFLVGCNCVDYCQNPATCACRRITYEASGNKSAGYKFRRLQRVLSTGVFECNDTCKCGPGCGNRVVQNGLQVRLQMFKTEKKGWGIRCLDDIACGMFICIYAGKILTEEVADEEGRRLGDEYLAELDYIEVNETLKADYEPDVPDYETVDDSRSEDASSPSSENEVNVCDSDSDFESSLRTTANTTYTTRSRKKPSTNSNGTSVYTLYSSQQDYSKSSRNQDLPDIHTFNTFTISERPLSPRTAAAVEKTELKRIPQIMENGSENKSATKKSYSLNYSLLPAKPQIKTHGSLRRFFDEKESLFVMDAKIKGNIGRYLNHSCDPNLFVQSVFVTTHDARFNEVAFFSHKFIMAGTELTWDYNYEIDSIEKRLNCYCDSRFCRGRLL